jgi:hypothetical protein
MKSQARLSEGRVIQFLIISPPPRPLPPGEGGRLEAWQGIFGKLNGPGRKVRIQRRVLVIR